MSLVAPTQSSPARGALAPEGGTGRAPQWARVLGAPLAVYFMIAWPIVQRQIDRMNPDAVAYIRRAMYLANGDFAASVSGYWSPMISWSIAPLLKIGVDGVHAARYVLLLWGIVFLVAFYAFLKRLGGLTDLWKALALTATAVVLPILALRQITPDVILATWLLVYFGMVVSERFMKDPRVTFLAGTVGGVAYLAKAYAFPFVILHLPLTIAVRAIAERGTDAWSPTLRRAGVSLAIAGVGFAVVALPWVAVLSVKYQHFTFSTTGRVAHSVVGPPGLKQPSATRLELAPDPYISANENPESADYTPWSPLQSREYFNHQMRVVGKNAAGMWDAIRTYHLFKLPLVALALVAGVLVCLGAIRTDHTERWKIVWLIGTMVLYVSGFLLVFFVPRYILPVVLPLGIVLALLVLRQGTLRSGNGMSPSWGMPVRIAVAVLLCASVAWGARKDLEPMWTKESNPWHRKIAAELKQRNMVGPLASSDRIKGLYVAFHAGQKYLNFPTAKNPKIAGRQLLEYHPAALLIWSKKGNERGEDEADDGAEPGAGGSGTLAVAEAVVEANPNWKSVFSSSFRKEKVEVFVPVVNPEAAAGHEGSSTASGAGDMKKDQ